MATRTAPRYSSGAPNSTILGLAVDFGDIKRPLKNWIDTNWDHAFLLNDRDQSLIGALQTIPESKLYCFPDRKPSAEAMAFTLYGVMSLELGCDLLRVRIWEAGQYADYIPDNPSMAQEGAHRMTRKLGVILLSGGLDSTTAATQAVSEGYDLVAVTRALRTVAQQGSRRSR